MGVLEGRLEDGFMVTNLERAINWAPRVEHCGR